LLVSYPDLGWKIDVWDPGWKIPDPGSEINIWIRNTADISLYLEYEPEIARNKKKYFESKIL
jgi:hypothetical protein